jgi:bifunctional non-homologous end joining protein LigD
VPVQAAVGWRELKAFSKTVAESLVRAFPGRYTTNPAKSKRTGRIFIDYLRNGRGATAVAAFSPRAQPHAPLSMPLSWEDLAPSLRPEDYTVTRALAGMGIRGRDPWRRFFRVKQSLPSLEEIGD